MNDNIENGSARYAMKIDLLRHKNRALRLKLFILTIIIHPIKICIQIALLNKFVLFSIQSNWKLM